LHRPLITFEIKRFDAVVFDPPRQGAPAQARALAASGVTAIIAMSCNPVTFARGATPPSFCAAASAWSRSRQSINSAILPT